MFTIYVNKPLFILESLRCGVPILYQGCLEPSSRNTVALQITRELLFFATELPLKLRSAGHFYTSFSPEKTMVEAKEVCRLTR